MAATSPHAPFRLWPTAPPIISSARQRVEALHHQFERNIHRETQGAPHASEWDYRGCRNVDASVIVTGRAGYSYNTFKMIPALFQHSPIKLNRTPAENRIIASKIVFERLQGPGIEPLPCLAQKFRMWAVRSVLFPDQNHIGIGLGAKDTKRLAIR